ncbi:DUF3995 domain-containing protein [Streptosporangium sp. NPDC000239]|uniref:DUF3995 domain-containing protein n=1 Tax=Streptosporangium sp. NPDC000239 TaxID=3154248 RepID=UPI00331D92BA
MSLSLDATGHPARWPGYATAFWGFAFAVPSFCWALGIGLAGASTTLSPQLVELAARQDSGFITALWVTGVLKVVGAVLGLALIRRRPWGHGMNLLLQLTAWGAGVLLICHGAGFVVNGILVETNVVGIDPELRSVSRWYTYLWGPWFVAGGVAFLLAARAHLRGVAERRNAVIAGIIGGLGALAISVMLLIWGLG